jgi:multicomponent Na+:H+ antiporter subunit D
MSTLLVAPFAAPLLAAALGLLTRSWRGVQRAVTGVLMVIVLGCGVGLVTATLDGAAVATRIGDWPSGLAIPFAADGLSAIMLLATSAMATLALVFAAANGEDEHQLFHPLVAVLLAGVFGSFLTADLFNLFVTFEVMLIGSYVLLTLRGGRTQVRAGTLYVTVNLLASTLFLLGIALVYGTAGAVNFSELAGITERVPTSLVGFGVIFTAVAVKAGLVPLHGWLPRTYTTCGPAVTVLFSALLTKAGVYVLLRLSSLVLGTDVTWRPVLLGVAVLTMVVGVLGAVGRGDMRGILTFHMVSQVGYLALPLGIWSVAGVTAGLFYLVQYVLVKGALLIVAGTVERLTGTGALAQLGGLGRSRPWLMVAFVVPALALAGLPPSSGFLGKVLLLRAAFDDAHWVAGGAIVLVSLFTLLSMVKIFTGVFWGAPTAAIAAAVPGRARAVPVVAGGAGDTVPAHLGPQAPAGRDADLPRWRIAGMVGPALLVAVLTILIGVAGQPLIELIEPAARTLIDPTPYLEAVRSA